jgi:hypothetical protein
MTTVKVTKFKNLPAKSLPTVGSIEPGTFFTVEGGTTVYMKIHMYCDGKERESLEVVLPNCGNKPGDKISTASIDISTGKGYYFRDSEKVKTMDHIEINAHYTE